LQNAFINTCFEIRVAGGGGARAGRGKDAGDRLRVGWLGGVPREQTMLKGHLPRVMYHQVY